MPDDDYHTPGGGLKLKGSKPSGIKKKKKKPSSSSTTTTPSRETALQKAAAAGDDDDDASSKPSEEDESLRELEPRDPHDGKTAAEKAAEEMRRKRVRVFAILYIHTYILVLPQSIPLHSAPRSRSRTKNPRNQANMFTRTSWVTSSPARETRRTRSAWRS